MNKILKNLVSIHDNPKLVIDVGGYMGDYASEVYDRFGAKVIIFEPIKEYADVCEERFKGNWNIKVMRMALGKDNGKSEMYKSKAGSSVFNGLAKSNEIEIVQSAKLSDFMNDTVDVVKLNCEGGEYDILQDLLETYWLSDIPEILVQFHKLKSHKQFFRDLQKELSKTHILTNSIKTWQLWKKK